MLKHNKFKPPSLELKEDLELEEQSLLSRVNAILQAKAAAADGAKTTLAAVSCAETAAALAVRARPSSSTARRSAAESSPMAWAACTAESERAYRTVQRRCAERQRDVRCSLAAADSRPGGSGRALARHRTAAAAHRPKLSCSAESPCACMFLSLRVGAGGPRYPHRVFCGYRVDQSPRYTKSQCIVLHGSTLPLGAE